MYVQGFCTVVFPSFSGEEPRKGFSVTPCITKVWVHDKPAGWL